MVFRGKPSKACERCRVRRLRCDLHSSTCGQCGRANVPCSGYRETSHLRIANESESVVRKALRKSPPFLPESFSSSNDLQARDAFFAYYVPSTSKYWAFVKRYHRLTDTPHHLTLAIEAVSLAYLWHQVYSDSVLVTARERYVSALRTTGKILEYAGEAAKDATLLVALLLDLFEKITDSRPQSNRSWTCHVKGALALVRLRGLEEFQDPTSFRVLVRLSTNYLGSCIESGSPVPDELITVRAFLGKHLNLEDPNWRLSDLMVDYANLRSGIRKGTLSNGECVEASLALDGKLQTLDLEMPPSWQYSTTSLVQKSDRTFDFHFDSYPDGNISQGRNFIRLIRIFLNEYLLERYLASPTREKFSEPIAVAQNSIKTLTGEICACVPQYVDCDGAARGRLPTPEQPELLDQTSDNALVRSRARKCHSHTPNHQLNCYTIIFPLYVAGRSKASPDVKPWVIKQLHHISSHFYIRTAEVVARILERDTNIDPWEVFTVLGSYAFAA